MTPFSEVEVVQELETTEIRVPLLNLPVTEEMTFGVLNPVTKTSFTTTMVTVVYWQGSLIEKREKNINLDVVEMIQKGMTKKPLGFLMKKLIYLNWRDYKNVCFRASMVYAWVIPSDLKIVKDLRLEEENLNSLTTERLLRVIY